MSKATLGIITESQDANFDSRVLLGAQREALRHDIELVIDSLTETVGGTPRPIKLDAMRVQGVIVIGDAARATYIQRLHGYNIPVTLISSTVSGANIPGVQFDNAQGIHLLVRHLVVDCQRRSLLYIGGAPTPRDTDERAASFQHELLRYDRLVEKHFQISEKDSLAALRHGIQQVFKERFIPDGIIAADHSRALVALELLHTVPFKIPEEIVIAAFGDAPDAEDAGLTTIAADAAQLGAAGIRQLYKQVKGSVVGGITRLSVNLTVRSTSYMPTL